MARADLHVHTGNSDGTLALEDLPGAARRAGLDAVAVTDHDRFHPGLDAPVTERDGVTIVHGVELRVASERAGRVDLLGYGLRRTAALERAVERLQRDRIERTRAIVECVEDRLGVALDVDCREGVGRPHVARAVADHPETGYDYRGTFDGLIGDGRPCYVARDVPSFERGRALLAEACAVVGLAHPLRYDDPAAALALAEDLDAVELYYPYDRPVDTGPVERAIRERGLLATGGSDAHDRTLGLAGVEGEDYERFVAAVS